MKQPLKFCACDNVLSPNTGHYLRSLHRKSNNRYILKLNQTVQHLILPHPVCCVLLQKSFQISVHSVATGIPRCRFCTPALPKFLTSIKFIFTKARTFRIFKQIHLKIVSFLSTWNQCACCAYIHTKILPCANASLTILKHHTSNLNFRMVTIGR